MHQQPRLPRRVPSPTMSPSSAPSRGADQWGSTAEGRFRPDSSAAGKEDTNESLTEGEVPCAIPADSIKKLDQIVRNFFVKAAVVVLDARIQVNATRNASGSQKTNKWFQIETSEIDDFRNELRIWKICGSFHDQPPPLVVELYFDLSLLRENQSLVMLDDDGKRWDVAGRLYDSSERNLSRPAARYTELLLERWRVELKPAAARPKEDFSQVLPTVYKKAIVFFRSLYIMTRLLPAWRLAPHAQGRSSNPVLTPRCRLRTAVPDNPSADPLRRNLDGRAAAVTEYPFGDLETPIGRFCVAVTYRNDCSFRVDDTESLLSSRLMGADENYFTSHSRRYERRHESPVKPGSWRDGRPVTLGEMHQTYGSLSTFHGVGPLGTSPLSALRAVKPAGSDSSSPPASLPSQTGFEMPQSMPVSGHPSPPRPLSRPEDGLARRTSISFQPFKAVSLSGSPVPGTPEPESFASTQSTSRPGVPSAAGSLPKYKSSLTAGMASSLRGMPQASRPETAVAGSPRPASSVRYSSSFTHRRGRPSIGGNSKGGDEERSSSGRQSLASSVAQPGSSLLADVGPSSSGSLQAEEDDIADFLKVLDSKKTLRSFEPTKSGASATNKTVAQLSKFHSMRDSNNVLGESLTSSVQLQPSSSSSSRHTTNLPGMGAPTSGSISTSPGKPISPHTPHTPAIPSRLSENSIIDYGSNSRDLSRGGRRTDASNSDANRAGTSMRQGTSAIDIPLSPRTYPYLRRSSSMAQQSRAMIYDEDADLPFAAHRSISLGADDRDPPNISTLLDRQGQGQGAAVDRGDRSAELQPAAGIQASDSSDAVQRGSADENTMEGLMTSGHARTLFPRRRYGGMAAVAAGAGAAGGGTRPTPPQSSRGSFTGSQPSRKGRR